VENTITPFEVFLAVKALKAGTGVNIRGGERGGRLSPPISQRSRNPPFESFPLRFQIVLLKSL